MDACFAVAKPENPDRLRSTTYNEVTAEKSVVTGKAVFSICLTCHATSVGKAHGNAVNSRAGCNDCHEPFELVLTLKEHDAEIKCPKCGSKNVEQEATAFYAVTGKKS